MNVLVMDVEGTDGRERGEDQVCLPMSVNSNHLNPLLRISNASRRCSLLHRQKFSLSTSGSTKSVCIKVPIWVSLRPCSR